MMILRERMSERERETREEGEEKCNGTLIVFYEAAGGKDGLYGFHNKNNKRRRENEPSRSSKKGSSS